MAPGNRLLLTVHLRGEVDSQRVDIVENGRRTPLSSDGDVWTPQFVPPNHLLFVRRQTNPGVWTVPFDGGPLDLTRASMVQPGAAGFAAARDGTLMLRFMPKERRDLVWVTRSGTTTTVPGRAREMTAGTFGLAPDGGRALISTLGSRLQGGSRRARSRRGHGHTRAAAATSERDDDRGHCLLGAWRTPVLRHWRRRNVRDSSTGPPMDSDWGSQARRGPERTNGGGPSGDLLHARRERCGSFAAGGAATRRDGG